MANDLVGRRLCTSYAYLPSASTPIPPQPLSFSDRRSIPPSSRTQSTRPSPLHLVDTIFGIHCDPDICPCPTFCMNAVISGLLFVEDLADSWWACDGVFEHTPVITQLLCHPFLLTHLLLQLYCCYLPSLGPRHVFMSRGLCMNVC
jgi:hypothetical protein